MNMNEFKVGDIVKVIDKDCLFAEGMEEYIGRSGVVDYVDREDNTVDVSFGNVTYSYLPSSLELVIENASDRNNKIEALLDQIYEQIAKLKEL